MPGRLFDRLTAPVRGALLRPIRGLHQAAYLLALLTLASQLLALLRDRTFAHTFGAGEILDLYYAAFRIPDLVFALVASLVSAYVIIPRLAGLDREGTRELLSETASFLLGMGAILCFLLGVYMPEFLTFLYPDLMVSSQRDAFVLLSRLLLLQPLLLGLSSIFGSVTQVHRRFVLFALSPVLYNIGIIFGAVVLYPAWGLPGIGAGVILGSVAYLLVNVPALREAGVFPQLRLPQFRHLVPIIRDSIPRSLALGMGSFTVLALTALASRAGDGAISTFTFASNLVAVPLALVGSSYAIAAFPALSEASALEKRQEFTAILSASARHIVLWSIVALGLIVVLRAHLVRVVLGTGAFDWNATRLTAALLAVLAVGLVAQGLVLLFSRALYAARQSWRPFLYQLAGGAGTVLLAILLLRGQGGSLEAWLATTLRIADVEGTSILLIALAATVGQLFLLLFSFLALRSVTPGLFTGLLVPLRDGSLAAIAGGLAAYMILVLEGGIAPLTTLLAVFTQGCIAGIIGLIVAGLALSVVENEEFHIVVQALSRLLRTKPAEPIALAPSGDDLG